MQEAGILGHQISFAWGGEVVRGAGRKMRSEDVGVFVGLNCCSRGWIERPPAVGWCFCECPREREMRDVRF